MVTASPHAHHPRQPEHQPPAARRRPCLAVDDGRRFDPATTEYPSADRSADPRPCHTYRTEIASLRARSARDPPELLAPASAASTHQPPHAAPRVAEGRQGPGGSPSYARPGRPPPPGTSSPPARSSQPAARPARPPRPPHTRKFPIPTATYPHPGYSIAGGRNTPSALRRNAMGSVNDTGSGRSLTRRTPPSALRRNAMGSVNTVPPFTQKPRTPDFRPSALRRNATGSVNAAPRSSALARP